MFSGFYTYIIYTCKQVVNTSGGERKKNQNIDGLGQRVGGGDDVYYYLIDRPCDGRV